MGEAQGLAALHDFAARARRQGAIGVLREVLYSTSAHPAGCDCSLCVGLGWARLRLRRLEYLEADADVAGPAGSTEAAGWKRFRLRDEVVMAAALDESGSPLERCRGRRLYKGGARTAETRYEGPPEAIAEVMDGIAYAIQAGRDERGAPLVRALRHLRRVAKEA